MNDVLRVARVALQRAFLGRAILIFTCSSELQQWDKESKDTFIVVTRRCKNEGTYFVLSL